MRIRGLIVCLFVVVLPADVPAQNQRARSTLFLDQSDLRGRFDHEVFRAFRQRIAADAQSHLTVYAESLELAVTLRFMSKSADRPITFAAKTFLDVPIAPANVGKPIFDGPQMLRWNVSEAALPEGSEIREPGLWQQYRWQSAIAVTVLLTQATLISILLHERRRRSDAEQDARRRLAELAHVHRQSIAGELSSSIAHELNQPLGSILTNAETAELILDGPNPDLREIKEILADIRHDDLRASQIIGHMRSLLKRSPFELKEVDLNEVMREAFDLMSAQAAARNVALYLNTAPGRLLVSGDSIQLQQVILNLVFNAMDAMTDIPFGRTIIARTEADGGSGLVSIADSGPGIPTERPNEIFDPFFTTKEQGMGIGLSIARTIVQAHKGRIWAENQPEGGAIFSMSLPLLPR